MIDRHVFIVDDSLKDATGLLLSLHAALLNSRDSGTDGPLSPDGVRLAFTHICWDESTARQGRAAFGEAEHEVRARVRAAGREAFPTEYVPVLLDAASGPEEQCGQVLEAQARLLLPFGDVRQAALLAMILDPRTDVARLEEGKEVLSALLCRHYTAARCAVYTPYPTMSVCGAWKRAAGMEGEIIRWEYLARPRALYLPLQRLLTDAL